jgi:hypothetical protein
MLARLHQYNWHRCHASLGYRPPISRITIPLKNVLGLHTWKGLGYAGVQLIGDCDHLVASSQCACAGTIKVST